MNTTNNNNTSTTNVPTIPMHLLDAEPHEQYMKRYKDTNNIRHQLLNLLATTTAIRMNGRAAATILNTTHTNTINVVDQLKFFFNLGSGTFNHLDALLKELNQTLEMHLEHHAHTIVQELVQLLRELRNKGNQSEINAANQIIKAYEAPILTRPSSPSSKSDEDKEIIPIPIRFPSAWCKIARNAIQTNKENIPPPKSTNPFTINPVKEEPIKNTIPNINDEDINQEVIHLKSFLFTVPTAPCAIEFKLPSDYKFWIKQDNKLEPGYWKVILTTFMMKNK